jgi:glycosyltransferase involved in cell wall biosynthesis
MQIDSPQLRQQANLTVSIVICTRNRPNLLRKCLEGIARLELAPDEVIVVDNTSGDKEAEAVVRDFSATYVVEPVKGLSRARNRGLAESHSEIVAYLDDDATPDLHWLGRMLEPFKDPQVSAVAGKIVTPESQAEAHADQPARFLDKKDPKWFEIVTFGGLGLGSNMALRRSPCIGKRIFDERLGRGAPFQIAEENYAFAFLIARGYTAVYLPDAIVFHPPLKNGDLRLEARNRIAYWMLLFSEFPGRRMDLLRFLFRRLRRRLRREPLTWPRDAPDPGAVVSSGWRVLLVASLSGLFLFLRTRKPR